jgi:hypothetical protein
MNDTFLKIYKIKAFLKWTLETEYAIKILGLFV